MEIVFLPNDRERSSGIASYASWDNQELQAALRKAFNTSEREELVKIEVERHGIKAFFEPKNCCR